MDIIRAGSVDQSILFAIKAIHAVTEYRATYTRYTRGLGTSFTTSTNALTALASITTAHTDNKAIHMSAVATDGAKLQLRVDYPDAAFATGKDEVICTIYDDNDEEVAHRIFSLVPEAVDLYGGYIWLDSENGEHDAPGTADRPVLNLPEAVALTVSTGIRRINVSPRSDIGTTVDLWGLEITGTDYVFWINEDVLDACTIRGAVVNGTMKAGGVPSFENCELGDGDPLTVTELKAKNCRLRGNFILNEVGALYAFDDCKAYDNDPVLLSFDKGNSNVVMHNYRGRVEVEGVDVGGISTSYFELDGQGEFIENSNNAVGSSVMVISGLFEISKSTLEPLTYSDESNFDLRSEILAIKEATDKLPHTVRRDQAIPGFKFVMLNSSGNPTAGLTVTATVKLDAEAVWSTLGGAITDNGFGVYSVDIYHENTDGVAGIWRFTAPGAKPTLISFLTEVK